VTFSIIIINRGDQPKEETSSGENQLVSNRGWCLYDKKKQPFFVAAFFIYSVSFTANKTYLSLNKYTYHLTKFIGCFTVNPQ